MTAVQVAQTSYEMPPHDGFSVTHFITVADIDRAADFYEKVFGGRILSRGGNICADWLAAQGTRKLCETGPRLQGNATPCASLPRGTLRPTVISASVHALSIAVGVSHVGVRVRTVTYAATATRAPSGHASGQCSGLRSARALVRSSRAREGAAPRSRRLLALREPHRTSGYPARAASVRRRGARTRAAR